MRVAFVGGGTGGHLTPAIGIAEELQCRGHQVEFWLSGRLVEQNYIADDFTHRSLGIDQSSLPRQLAMFPAAMRLRKYCGQFNPHILVSLGGYAGAAALASPRRTLVCLEGNAVVGKSVKYLSRFAEQVLVMFKETAASLPRSTVVGPISRSSTRQPSREEACLKFGLDPSRPVLLTMGGSQGAASLNGCVLKMLPEIVDAGWQLLALTGANKSAELRRAVENCGASAAVLEHCADMGAAYACADFMLSRGGASTLAEVWLNTTPTMVMPYLHKDMQQHLNAELLSPGVQLFDGSELSRKQLLHNLNDSEAREAMRSALSNKPVADGKKIACDTLEEIAARKS
jgi:UDP-N-acetylglucosamine--N-acetylmuramyl-(pentapeptide) pyrophosphoryl-undecaprenol N-acetylglucosamine transferase